MNASTILTPARSPGKTALELKTLIPFLALTFGLTWELAALLFLFYDQIVAIFGEVSHEQPAFYPGRLRTRGGRLSDGPAPPWAEGSGLFLTPPDPVARPHRIVAAARFGHPPDVLCWRRDERQPRRAVPLLIVI